MSSVSLGPMPQGASFFKVADLSPVPRATTPETQQVESKLNASGRRAVGDQAVQASMDRLRKLFDAKNVNVTMSFDSQKGSQITITDGNSGRPIAKMPPEAVVAIADKAVQQMNGLILDKMA